MELYCALSKTTFDNKPRSKSRGNYWKPKECASGASCRAQAGAIAGREVRSSDLGDRVVKRFGKASQPTRIISAPSRRKMAQVQKARWGRARKQLQPLEPAKTTGPGSCEARHVRGSSPEDRGVPAGTMGKDQATKEGCVALRAASLTRNQHVVPNVTFPI